MKLRIDPTLCQGSQCCVQAVPEVFEMRADMPIAHVRMESPPVELEARIRDAEGMCPTGAIFVETVGT